MIPPARRSGLWCVLQSNPFGQNSQMSICRALDHHSGPAASGGFSTDVYFVARNLRRLWPELSGPDPRMEIRQVDPTRLHTNESIWIVSTYLRLKDRRLNVRIVDRLV